MSRSFAVLLVAPLVAACVAPSSADPPPAPKVTELRGHKSIGPAKSAGASCRTIAPCGGTDYDDRAMKVTNPPKAPDCSILDGKERDANVPATSSLHHRAGDTEVWIAPNVCARPKGLRIQESRYFVFVKRGDSWWRTDAQFVLDTNEKYCGVELRATWETRGNKIVGFVRGETGCPACNKPGAATIGLDFYFVVDTAGPSPQVYGPIVAGQHSKIEPHDFAEPGTCAKQDTHVTLKPSWSADVFTLTGPATWSRLERRAAGGLELHFDDSKQVPSAAGSYRFVPAK